jgi:hypothetical protein
MVADEAGQGNVGAGAAMSAEVDPEVAAKERRLELILLGQPLSERTRAAVLGQSSDSTAAIQAAKEFQGGGAGGGGPLAGLIGPDPAMPRANGLGVGAGGGATVKATIPDDRQAAIMAGLLLGSPEFQRR